MAYFRFKKTIPICLIALGLLRCVSSLAQSPFQLPNLKTDSEKIKYLTYIHEHLPKLFEDAAKYDVNLFTMLDDQEKLVELLRKYPEYEKESRPLLKVKIEVESGQVSKSYKMDPELFKQWQKNLLESYEEWKDAAKSNPKFFKLADYVQNLKDQLGKRTPTGLYSGLISSLKDPSLNASIAGKTLNEKLHSLVPHLPHPLPESFRAADYGLDKNVSPETLEKKLLELQTLEKKISRAFSMETIVQSSQPHLSMTIQSGAAIEDAVRNTSSQDLFALTDPDATRAVFMKMGFDKNKSAGLAKEIRQQNIQYTKQVEFIDSNANHKLQLIEVPPGVGIFRGCSGGDCSSQFSFPYPNDPNERVFFIANEKGTLKGYLTGTIVHINDEPIFYAITTAGLKVSSTDTRAIFGALDQLKGKLGVKGIAIPTSINQSALLNFAEVKGVYQELTQLEIAKGKSAVDIKYQNQDLRKTIETFQSTYNHGHYDHISANQQGHVLSSETLKKTTPNLKLEISENTSHWNYVEKPINRQEILLFAIDLKGSRREDELTRVLKELNMDLNTFDEIEKVIFNRDGLKVKEYEQQVDHAIQKLFAHTNVALPSDEQIQRLYEYGYAQSSDLFTPENRTRSFQFFKNKIYDSPEESANQLFKEIYKPLAKNIDGIKDIPKLFDPTVEFYLGKGFYYQKDDPFGARGHQGLIDLVHSDSNDPEKMIKLMLRFAPDTPELAPKVAAAFAKNLKKVSASYLPEAIKDALNHSWYKDLDLKDSLFNDLKNRAYLEPHPVSNFLLNYDSRMTSDAPHLKAFIDAVSESEHLDIFKAVVNRPNSFENPEMQRLYHSLFGSELEQLKADPTKVKSSLFSNFHYQEDPRWLNQVLNDLHQLGPEFDTVSKGDLFAHLQYRNAKVASAVLEHLKNHPGDLTVNLAKTLAADRKVGEAVAIVRGHASKTMEEALMKFRSELNVAEALSTQFVSGDTRNGTEELLKFLRTKDRLNPEEISKLSAFFESIPKSLAGTEGGPYPAALARLLLSPDETIQKQAFSVYQKLNLGSWTTSNDFNHVQELLQSLKAQNYEEFFKNSKNESYQRSMKRIIQDLTIKDAKFFETFKTHIDDDRGMKSLFESYQKRMSTIPHQSCDLMGLLKSTGLANLPKSVK